MTSIELPLKKFSKSSIDLLQKAFDPKLSGKTGGELSDDASLEYFYINRYVSTKYKNILHTLPFLQLDLFSDGGEGRTIATLTDNDLFRKFFSWDSSTGGYLQKYRETTKRFTYYLIGTSHPSKSTKKLEYNNIHALYDKETYRVEIFYGGSRDSLRNFTSVILDLFIEIYGDGIDVDYRFADNIAFSNLETKNCNKTSYKYNSEWFSSLWAVWFLELRLSNPDMPRGKLAQKALNKLKNDKKVCEVIRGYGQFIDTKLPHYVIYRSSSGLTIKSRKKLDLPLLYKRLMSITLIPKVFGTPIFKKNNFLIK